MPMPTKWYSMRLDVQIRNGEVCLKTRTAISLALLIASGIVIGFSLLEMAKRDNMVRLSESALLRTEYDLYPAGTSEVVLLLVNEGRYPITNIGGSFIVLHLEKWDGADWVEASYVAAGSRIPVRTALPPTNPKLQPGEREAQSYFFNAPEGERNMVEYASMPGEYRIPFAFRVDYEAAGRVWFPRYFTYAYFRVQE